MLEFFCNLSFGFKVLSPDLSTIVGDRPRFILKYFELLKKLTILKFVTIEYIIIYLLKNYVSITNSSSESPNFSSSSILRSTRNSSLMSFILTFFGPICPINSKKFKSYFLNFTEQFIFYVEGLSFWFFSGWFF